MTTARILSIDFDFFSFEDPSWDWGHTERGVIPTDMLWAARAFAAKAQGFDLEEMTSLDLSDPHPNRFWAELTRLGFSFKECQHLTVADSHQWAAPALMYWVDHHHRSAQVINIDAHHDMGYGATLNTRKHGVDCSNWLLSLVEDRDVQVRQVYPAWKGDHEIQIGGTPWTKKVAKRFQHGVFSNTAYLQSLAGPVDYLFIAKSSAWLPPWHDPAFLAFVDQAEQETGCGPDWFRNPGSDPSVARDWSPVQLPPGVGFPGHDNSTSPVAKTGPKPVLGTSQDLLHHPGRQPCLRYVLAHQRYGLPRHLRCPASGVPRVDGSHGLCGSEGPRLSALRSAEVPRVGHGLQPQRDRVAVHRPVRPLAPASRAGPVVREPGQVPVQEGSPYLHGLRRGSAQADQHTLQMAQGPSGSASDSSRIRSPREDGDPG